MSHTMTVTRIIDDPNADTQDPEYTIGGEHDYSCQTFRPCEKEWHRHPKNEYTAEWDSKRYGFHARIEGEWMALDPNGCGLRYAFEYDNPEFQMTELGTFDVDVDWDGDYWTARLTPVPSVEKERSK